MAQTGSGSTIGSEPEPSIRDGCRLLISIRLYKPNRVENQTPEPQSNQSFHGNAHLTEPLGTGMEALRLMAVLQREEGGIIIIIVLHFSCYSDFYFLLQ